MKKIDNWDEIQEGSSFKKLPEGGYVCAVKSVNNMEDKQYLWIEYDIVKGDEKGYYQKQYDTDTRNPKKWGGILVRSYKKTAESMFKGFITSVERSNKNFKWDWDETKLVKKMFGACVSYEEYVNAKGQVKIRPYISQIHSVEAIEKGEFEVQPLKKVENNSNTSSNNVPFSDPFANENQSNSTTPDPFQDDESDPFA